MTVSVPTLTGLPAPAQRANRATISLGQTAAAAAPAPPGFGTQLMQGLSAWSSPSMAFAALPQSFSMIGQAPGIVAGLWIPPLAIVAVVIGMMSKK